MFLSCTSWPAGCQRFMLCPLICASSPQPCLRSTQRPAGMLSLRPIPTWSRPHLDASLPGDLISVPLTICAAPHAAELLDLRKKFQQDKKRIAELRAQRRFRPY